MSHLQHASVDPQLAAPARLGTWLVRKGYLTQEQLEAALALQKSEGQGRLLGEILIDTGLGEFAPPTAGKFPSSPP